MIVKPKTRGFICTTAHPVGCARAVQKQIEYIKAQPNMEHGPRKVLIIGASTGYGLAARITATWACNAATLGVIYEKPASGNRTASAGWYNTAAFEKAAQSENRYAVSMNADAFQEETKHQVVERIKKDLGEVDLVIYSVAAPRRAMPDGTVVNSVLKTVGSEYSNKTIDLKDNSITTVTVPTATEQEIEDTIAVMGGNDWNDWISTLRDNGVLADGAVTVAFSYIGPELTHPMYLNGSIGKAKEHLYNTGRAMEMDIFDLKAFISVNKALVTQSSAAIPIVPLYIAMLYRVMKLKGLHEGCIEQCCRLFERLCSSPVPVDKMGRIRLDDFEMREDVQAEVSALWDKVTTENAKELCDIEGYWSDFYEMFGFCFEDVDYEADVEIDVPIPSLDVE